MTPQEMYTIITQIIDEAKTAILATVTSEGQPRLRWMTPGCLRDRPGALYMISGSKLSKVDQSSKNAEVAMMVQTPTLDKIVDIIGAINIVESPTLRSEVLECVGKQLGSFWKINPAGSELVVLEFVISNATYYQPTKGTKVSVNFSGGNT